MVHCRFHKFHHFLITSASLLSPVSSFSPLSSSSLLTSLTVYRNHHTSSTSSNTIIHRSTPLTILPSSSSAITATTTTTTTTLFNNNSNMKVSISDAYDGGNGKFLKAETIHDQYTVYVNIKKDPFTQLEQCHHFQYFSFRSSVSATNNSSSISSCNSNSNVVKYVLANAGKASYSKAWENSTVFVSTTPSDPFSWKRLLDTTYDTSNGELSWTYDHSNNNNKVAYFAYFPPYSYERHLDLISKCLSSPHLEQVQSLGQSLDGREMECVIIGKGSMKCWIIHRQHPGETMAEYYAEGLLSRLLGLDNGYSVDGKVKDVLNMYTFYIVPNMCPDGAYRGHLRTNAGGQNLNREWCSSGSKADGTFYEAPTLERSPEVYHILKKMDETGCDVFLDVHGDEELPFNFLAGSEGCPNWSPRLEALHGAFLAQYQRSNSDMQVRVAYEPEEAGNARMNVCSNQIALRFDCLAATLEMPFKDCLSNPDPERGWNPARAKMLGGSVLEPLYYVGPHLRTSGEFWNDAFVDGDKYVTPTSNYKNLS